MSHETDNLIAELKESLTQQRYNRVASHDYCARPTTFCSSFLSKGSPLTRCRQRMCQRRN
jgi:hypothetical protein